MLRKDLRNQIIPTTIDNSDENQKVGNKNFNTTDLIYLDSFEEQYQSQRIESNRRISPTDYTIMNNSYLYADTKTRTGKMTTYCWLRSAGVNKSVHCVDNAGFLCNVPYNLPASICPSLRYKISPDILDGKYDIKEVKDLNGKIIYHTLQLGEYPKTKVDERLSETLETLYNGGKIKDEISATGRWYSTNGVNNTRMLYAGKHSPEFEYNGRRYVRVVSAPRFNNANYSDGILTGQVGSVRWVKVEPISFVIRNWNNMPQSINPNGNGEATFFDLRAEDAITSNITFYPTVRDNNMLLWQNSTLRGFLNGIDVRNITENGVKKYSAKFGGNFTGECNFLNEAFNLSRKPIIEYAIPDSEIEILDNAFNGCVTLKKLEIHQGVETISQSAFEGVNFKYAYKNKNGNLIFSQEFPREKEEGKGVVNLDYIKNAFEKFDYNMLLKNSKLNELADLTEKLSKSKFNIPYSYAKALIDNEKVEDFCKNSDFRFYKSEVPNANEMLSTFSDDEKLSFYKFAEVLGCFSTEKLLDKRGRETETILAQKASTLLMRLIKSDKIRIRRI